MKNTTYDPLEFETMVKNWTQSMQNVMGPLPEWWSVFQPKAQPAEQENYNQSFDNMATAFKFWKSIASAMATPESINSFLKGVESIPDISAQFGQTILDSFPELQKKMSQNAAYFGKTTEAFNFEQFDKKLRHIWSDIYNEKFSKFFHIPQLGLTREYQERFNDMLDKFHQFQANQSEFIRLLGLPFQRSVTIMQEKISAMAEAGELPDDADAYYQMWIKVLEGCFMALFQTPEYVQAMSKTLGALNRFSKAKDCIIEDIIKGLPIARRSEMDDLAREIHELKKRIKTLEKKNLNNISYRTDDYSDFVIGEQDDTI